MKNKGFELPRTTDVPVTMSRRLLDRINTHLKMVGEPNRSSWIRAAIRKQLVSEEIELRDEEEEVN